MKTRHFLTGISMLAFAAGAATAQTAGGNNNSTSSTGGTNNFAFCDNSSFSGNTCRITQVGSENTGVVDQDGTDNTSTIDQNGYDNYAVSVQGGDVENGVSDGNTSMIDQDGDYNYAYHYQYGDENSASTTQDGYFLQSIIYQEPSFGNEQSGVTLSNSATVTQNNEDDDFGYGLFSYLEQYGANNSATVNQSGSTNDSRLYQDTFSDSSLATGNTASVTLSGFDNDSYASTNGEGNAVTLMLSGSFNRSNVQQGSDFFVDNNESSFETSLSFDNTVDVTMSGTNGASNVLQAAGTIGEDETGAPTFTFAAGSVSGNTATVTVQGGNQLAMFDDETGEETGNYSNSSAIAQLSSGNTATVFLAGGEANSAGTVGQGNTSIVLQQNTDGDFEDDSNNEVFVSLANGSQQSSDIMQDGTNNFADVTMTGGVRGNNSNADETDPEAGLSGGNSSDIDQTGSGSVASVNIQAARGTQFQGLGNSVTINQNATADYSARGAARPSMTTASTNDRIGYTEGSGAGNFTGSNGQYAEVWQQGRFGTATVDQSDNEQSGRTYGGTEAARSRAGIYQSGSLMSASITQVGDNYGEVTQGFGTEGQSNSVTLTQTDAGDVQTGTTPSTTTPGTTT